LWNNKKCFDTVDARYKHKDMKLIVASWRKRPQKQATCFRLYSLTFIRQVQFWINGNAVTVPLMYPCSTSVPPGKSRGSALNYALTASFHILSNSWRSTIQTHSLKKPQIIKTLWTVHSVLSFVSAQQPLLITDRPPCVLFPYECTACWWLNLFSLWTWIASVSGLLQRRLDHPLRCSSNGNWIWSILVSTHHPGRFVMADLNIN
jgi:hypothetical protein